MNPKKGQYDIEDGSKDDNITCRHCHQAAGDKCERKLMKLFQQDRQDKDLRCNRYRSDFPNVVKNNLLERKAPDHWLRIHQDAGHDQTG